MRIEIDPKAADDPESHQWLDRILPRIYEGWHVWDTTGQSNPDTLSATTWISTGGKRVKELFVASTSRNAWSTYGRVGAGNNSPPRQRMNSRLKTRFGSPKNRSGSWSKIGSATAHSSNAS